MNAAFVRQSRVGFLLLLVFLSTSAFADTEFSLTYEPGAATNTLRFLPCNGRSPELVRIDGITCLVAPNHQREESAFYLDIPDSLWKERPADLVLEIEYTSVVPVLKNAGVDSCFFAIHAIPVASAGSPFTSSDTNAPHVSHLFQFARSEGPKKARWVIPKAFLGNRVDGFADIKLLASRKGFCGIRRVVCRIQPVDPIGVSRLSSLDGLVRKAYRRFLARNPSRRERQMASSALSQGRVTWFQFFKGLLLSEEFTSWVKETLNPNDVASGIYRRVCFQEPTPIERFEMGKQLGQEMMDLLITVLLEKYFYQIMERLISEKGRERKNGLRK